MAYLRMTCFQNDEHCENLTLFVKHELFDLTTRLGLQKHVYAPHSTVKWHVFHQEDVFMHDLIKLAYGLNHTGMSDFVVSGNIVR